MSRMKSVSSVAKAQAPPFAPAGTMAAAALTRPSEFSVEVGGRLCPQGKSVRNPSLTLGTTVTFTEYAFAVEGMPQALEGMLKPRVVPAVRNGPPNGPFGLRVSATRHGVTGTKLKPAEVPVPDKATDCGLPDALSVTERVPLRGPVTVGVKVTLMLQFAPAASVLPQLFVWAKSPLAAMVAIDKGPVPLFVRMTVCAALVLPTLWAGKVTVVGERVAPGTVGRDPVPLRLTDWGLPEALSETFRDPGREPVVDGAKATLTLQLAFAANEVGQLLVWL